MCVSKHIQKKVVKDVQLEGLLTLSFTTVEKYARGTIYSSLEVPILDYNLPFSTTRM